MKHPHEKKDFRASNDAVEIRWLVQVCPPSLDSPWNVEIRWFAGSRRVSCQIANHPGWSTRTTPPNDAPPVVERVKYNARSMLVLQSSCTNATSSAPWSSTSGVENWFADDPVPFAPGASGTIAV